MLVYLTSNSCSNSIYIIIIIMYILCYYINLIAVDLVVDWLNNKLYWIDTELRHVVEFDLITKRKKVVLTTGSKETSSPLSLALYPYPNYG